MAEGYGWVRGLAWPNTIEKSRRVEAGLLLMPSFKGSQGCMQKFFQGREGGGGSLCEAHNLLWFCCKHDAIKWLICHTTSSGSVANMMQSL